MRPVPAPLEAAAPEAAELAGTDELAGVLAAELAAGAEEALADGAAPQAAAIPVRAAAAESLRKSRHFICHYLLFCKRSARVEALFMVIIKHS